MRRLALALLLPALAAWAATPASPRALRLLEEGRRELRAVQTTRYGHATSVDEGAGRFDFDCSGFLDYALGRVDPEALALLPVASKRKGRPLAQDFFTLFDRLPGRGRGPWRPVRSARNLKPGDIVAWLRAPENDSQNTGHVMLVGDHARPNPERADEILVPILDATTSPHAEDSRAPGATGLGAGLIGILVDRRGRPLGYRWKGGQSPHAVETAIAFGRLE